MDERTRLWQEIGLRFVFRTPRIASALVDVNSCYTSFISPQPVLSWSIDPDHPYPEPLMFYRRKLSPPITAFITYINLDHDFRGLPNESRIRLLHAIIDKAMPWSLEDVAFWPPAVYASTPVPHEDLEVAFLRVITDFSPKYILDFGGCVESLFPDRLHSVLHRPTNSALPKYVLLPSLDDMLPDNKPVKKAAWEIIRHLNS